MKIEYQCNHIEVYVDLFIILLEKHIKYYDIIIKDSSILEKEIEHKRNTKKRK